MYLLVAVRAPIKGVEHVSASALLDHLITLHIVGFVAASPLQPSNIGFENLISENAAKKRLLASSSEPLLLFMVT
jgi:hypothetical protein